MAVLLSHKEGRTSRYAMEYNCLSDLLVRGSNTLLFDMAEALLDGIIRDYKETQREGQTAGRNEGHIKPNRNTHTTRTQTKNMMLGWIHYLLVQGHLTSTKTKETCAMLVVDTTCYKPNPPHQAILGHAVETIVETDFN